MSQTEIAIVESVDPSVDAWMLALVSRLRRDGCRVVGILQDGPRIPQSGDTCKEIYLSPIGSSERFAVTQDLGRGARGCKLNPQGLMACCAYVAQDLAQGADLLVINRFGRSESTGQGFRDVIVQAIEAGIPVLTAVRPRYRPDIAEFCEGMAKWLPPADAPFDQWFAKQCRTDALASRQH